MNVNDAVRPTSTVLSAKALCFSYATRHVFSDWSGEFESGLTWLRGGNGSGKSTLIKLLAGALPSASGCLEVCGIDETTRPLDYRREVFWCGPGAMPFDHLRPPEYFGFLRGLYPRLNLDALAAHVQALDLQTHFDQRLGALSTGTQRKVWLAASLAVDTAVVLLDEPLNALDATSLAYFLHQLDVLTLQAPAPSQACRAWIVASHEDLGAAGQRAIRMALAPCRKHPSQAPRT